MRWCSSHNCHSQFNKPYSWAYEPTTTLFFTLPGQTWTRKRQFNMFNDIISKKNQTNMSLLPFWASWLWLVDELQQKRLSPRLTEAAVADSQHNLHLIKKAAPLSRADSRAGLVSFELGCRSLTVTWEVGRSRYRAAPTALLPVWPTRQSKTLHPETITYLSSRTAAAAATFDRTTQGYELYKPGRYYLCWLFGDDMSES